MSVATGEPTNQQIMGGLMEVTHTEEREITPWRSDLFA